SLESMNKNSHVNFSPNLVDYSSAEGSVDICTLNNNGFFTSGWIADINDKSESFRGKTYIIAKYKDHFVKLRTARLERYDVAKALPRGNYYLHTGFSSASRELNITNTEKTIYVVSENNGKLIGVRHECN
ncbi:hypothetical protein LK509_08960, partial [Citrobacter freundii]|nr:hypothetical protein [Citrobacter freundii]